LFFQFEAKIEKTIFMDILRCTAAKLLRFYFSSNRFPLNPKSDKKMPANTAVKLYLSAFNLDPQDYQYLALPECLLVQTQ
jgi:hypothetical protein